MTFSANDIIDRIKSLTSIKELEKIGISQPAISNWKARNTIPKADDLYKISDLLNVSMDYLLTGEEKNNSYSPDEVEIISNYRSLSDHDKAILKVIAAAMSSNQNL